MFRVELLGDSHTILSRLHQGTKLGLRVGEHECGMARTNLASADDGDLERGIVHDGEQ
jgi:hypothetical protein